MNMESAEERSGSVRLCGRRNCHRGSRGKRLASSSGSGEPERSERPQTNGEQEIQECRKRRKLTKLQYASEHNGSDYIELPQDVEEPVPGESDDKDAPGEGDNEASRREHRSSSPALRPSPQSSQAAAVHAATSCSANSSGNRQARETADFSKPVQGAASKPAKDGSGRRVSRRGRRSLKLAAARVIARKRKGNRRRRRRNLAWVQAREAERGRLRRLLRRRSRRHKRRRRGRRRSLSPSGYLSRSPSRSRSRSPHNSLESPRSTKDALALACNWNAACASRSAAAATASSGRTTTTASSGSSDTDSSSASWLKPAIKRKNRRKQHRNKKQKNKPAHQLDIEDLLIDTQSLKPRLMFTRFDLRPRSLVKANSNARPRPVIYTRRRVALDIGLMLINELLNLIWYSYNPSSKSLVEGHTSYKWRWKMEQNLEFSDVMKRAAKHRPSEFEVLPKVLQDAIELCAAADSVKLNLNYTMQICNTRNHMVHYNHDAMEEVLENIDAFIHENLIACLAITENDSAKVKHVLQLMQYFMFSAHTLVNILLDKRIYLKLVEQMLLYFAYAAGLVTARLEWAEAIKDQSFVDNKVAKKIIQELLHHIKNGRKGKSFPAQLTRPSRFEEIIPQNVINGGESSLAKYLDERMFFVKATVGPSTIAAVCHDISDTMRRFERYQDIEIITDQVLGQCELFYTVASCAAVISSMLNMSLKRFNKLKKEYNTELHSRFTKKKRPNKSHLWLD